MKIWPSLQGGGEVVQEREGGREEREEEGGVVARVGGWESRTGDEGAKQ